MMLVPRNMSGKRFGILGLGLSGMAAARALSAGGADCFLHDDNMQAPRPLPNGAAVADWRDWPWDRLDAMVIGPESRTSIPNRTRRQLRRHGRIPVISEVELAMRAAPKARIVAVTGTNGKSTTTARSAIALPHAEPAPSAAISARPRAR